MRERLPPIPKAKLSPTQKQVLSVLQNSPRGSAGGTGPFSALLRSPELTERVQNIGQYLRWGSRLSGDLRELTILLVARKWDSAFEWAVHVPAGLKEGLTDAQIDAIGRDRRPEGTAAQLAVHDFCKELLETQTVSDEVYDQLTSHLIDEELLIELVVGCGYYTLLAMVLNVARTPAPPNSAPLPAVIRLKPQRT